MSIKTTIALLAFLALPVAVATADESRMLADELTNAPGRGDEDKQRDAQRRPDQVLTFLGIRAGDTVLDIWAAGGWYTEVLSIAVGPDGKVYSQNPQAVLNFSDGRYEKLLTERLANGRLANVERVDAAVIDLDIPPASVDFAFSALNFHDVYNRQGKEAAGEFLAGVFNLLKPGGTLSYFEYAYIRPLRTKLTLGKTRQKINGVNAIVTEHLANHRIHRDNVLVNFPPAWAQHLRIEQPQH